MSTFAQRVQLGPFFSAGVIQGAAILEHYQAGTSTLKNIWSDRGMTTPLAQPLVADADGVWNFYGDGLYKLIIKAPDLTVLYTLDNWQFIDRTDPTFSEGPPISSASTIGVGPEVFAHISGSTDIAVITGTIPWIWAVFDGNLTLIHSASLLCPASINLAVRTGDAVLFLNEGSAVWRVASHMQSDGLVISTQDTRTNTVDQALVIRSTTSGAPAAGIGTGILIQAESTDEATADFGQMEFVASDVGASEATYFQILLRVAGAALSAAYRFVATTVNKAIFTHANTADRTYTWPDFSFTLASANSGSSIVLIETLDLSSTNVVTNLGSTYDEHLFQLIDVLPGTAGSNLLLTVSSDNGSTFADSQYDYILNGAAVVIAVNVPLLSAVAGTSTAAAINGLSGTITLIKPQLANRRKSCRFWVTASDVSGFPIEGRGCAQFRDAAPDVVSNAINAIKLAFSSGTISGTVRHYGLKNT